MRPRQVLPPYPAVCAEDRAEGSELEPAREQFTARGDHLVAPPDVRAPIRHAGHARVQRERDLVRERRERVDHVPGPGACAVALHAGASGTTQEERPLLRAVRGLALKEDPLPEKVESIVYARAIARMETGLGRRSLAPIQPPSVDAQLALLVVQSPPPLADLRVREINVLLALPVVGVRAGQVQLRVALLQQVALRKGLLELRRLRMKYRILMRHHVEVHPVHLGEQRLRVVPKVGLELEVPDTGIPSLGIGVTREEDQPIARNPVVAKLARQLAQFVGVAKVARRLQESEHPSGRHQRRAQEGCQLLHHAAQVWCDEHIKIQRPACRRVGYLRHAVGSTEHQSTVGRVVEEDRVATARHRQRHRNVGSGPMAHHRIPQLPCATEPVELLPALAQPVEMLVPYDLEPRIDAIALRHFGRASSQLMSTQESPVTVAESQLVGGGRNLHLAIRSGEKPLSDADRSHFWP